jgi:phytoene dehydrogenase-like protein
VADDKSVMIVGAGIAGLSAGCYARMNGYRATVVEMHDKPGGLLTAWKRTGYTIDGCIHWLVGSTGLGYTKMWRELGMVQGREFVNAEEFYRVEWPDGRTFVLYCDPDRLQRHITELSPEDADAAKDLCECIRRTMKADAPVGKPAELWTFFNRLGNAAVMMPRYLPLGRWFRYSTGEYVTRFKSELVRAGFTLAWPEDFPLLFLAMTLGWMAKKAAGYPIGGSLGLAEAVSARFAGLGGETRYKARVTGIVVESDRAVGVRLANGEELRADHVVWAADSHTALFDLLERRYMTDKALWPFDNLKPFPALVFVGLGVRRKFDEVPVSVSGLQIKLAQPVELAGKTHDSIGLHVFNQDPTLAPPGCTVVTAMLESDLEWWQKLAADRPRYEAEKAKVADAIVALLEKRFPGAAALVEMRDVATPVTFTRYTGNWKGSFEGWMVSPRTWNTAVPKRLPGLSGFYMCGHWVMPGGGLPPSAQSGRDVLQLICAQDRRRFTATLA